MGNAGTLTEEQLSALLDGVYYKDDKNNAKIIIVEYSDLLCPFCKRHYNDRSLENIVDEDANIALVFKNMPIPSLHPNAPLGAKGVDCAGKLSGSKGYYEFLDAAMAESDFSLNGIAAIANKLGLDADEFAACYNS
jgi:protein-disulfide isomerase